MTMRIALTLLLVIGCSSKPDQAPAATATTPAPAVAAAPVATPPVTTPPATSGYCLVQRKIDGNNLVSITSTDRSATLCTTLHGAPTCGALDLESGTWAPAPLARADEAPLFTYGGADHPGELCRGTTCVKLALPKVPGHENDNEYDVDRSASGTFVAHNSGAPGKYHIVDPETGKVKKTVTLPSGPCGGGLAFVDDTLYLHHHVCPGEDVALYTLAGKRLSVIEDVVRTPPVKLRDDVYVVETTQGYTEVNVKTGAVKVHEIDFSTAADEDYATMSGDAVPGARFAALPNGKLLYVKHGLRLIDPATGAVERVYHHAACPRDENW